MSKFQFTPDRVRMAMEKGEEIQKTCSKCGFTSKYHVDEFYAELISGSKFLVLSLIPLLSALIFLLIISSPIIAMFIGMAPITIGFVVYQKQRKRLSDFNRHKLVRTTHSNIRFDN